MAKTHYIVIFNKILEEPGTSFQPPELIENHVRNVYHTAH